jgi:hypothetical protein
MGTNRVHVLTVITAREITPVVFFIIFLNKEAPYSTASGQGLFILP